MRSVLVGLLVLMGLLVPPLSAQEQIIVVIPQVCMDTLVQYLDQPITANFVKDVEENVIDLTHWETVTVGTCTVRLVLTGQP